MGKLHAINNLKKGEWIFDTFKVNPTHNHLFIGFADESSVVEFNDLKFGYELRSVGSVLKQSSYPPEGVRYVNSDQPYLVAERLLLQAETDYELYLWAENDGQHFDTTIEFTTPRPAQPYDSWVWNGVKWEAPVEKPSDGQSYAWDEETTDWVVVEES